MDCPTCDGAMGEFRVPRSIGVVDQFCDSCSTRLRLRFFHGELIDVEDLDLQEGGRSPRSDSGPQKGGPLEAAPELSQRRVAERAAP